jgi:transcriptional regulator with XRE-family HTH domain
VVTTDDRPLSPFARRARELRQLRGLSQETVANNGGFSPGYIGSIESGARGTHISRDFVLKYAKGLRATDAERNELLRLAGHLVEGEQEPTRPGFVEAVNSDPRLRSDQRDVLLRLYKTFVG